MDVEDLVRAYLLADGTIAGLVGTRIYPAPPPQGATYPLITTQMISNVQSEHLRQRGPGLAEPRFQVDAWATTKADAKRLGRAIQNRLQGFVGHLPGVGSPAANHWVWIRYDSGLDDFEKDVTGNYWRRSADYFIGHQGTAA